MQFVCTACIGSFWLEVRKDIRISQNLYPGLVLPVLNDVKYEGTARVLGFRRYVEINEAKTVQDVKQSMKFL